MTSPGVRGGDDPQIEADGHHVLERTKEAHDSNQGDRSSALDIERLLNDIWAEGQAKADLAASGLAAKPPVTSTALASVDEVETNPSPSMYSCGDREMADDPASPPDANVSALKFETEDKEEGEILDHPPPADGPSPFGHPLIMDRPSTDTPPWFKGHLPSMAPPSSVAPQALMASPFSANRPLTLGKAPSMAGPPVGTAEGIRPRTLMRLPSTSGLHGDVAAPSNTCLDMKVIDFQTACNTAYKAEYPHPLPFPQPIGWRNEHEHQPVPPPYHQNRRWTRGPDTDQPDAHMHPARSEFLSRPPPVDSISLGPTGNEVNKPLQLRGQNQQTNKQNKQNKPKSQPPNPPKQKKKKNKKRPAQQPPQPPPAKRHCAPAPSLSPVLAPNHPVSPPHIRRLPMRKCKAQAETQSEEQDYPCAPRYDQTPICIPCLIERPPYPCNQTETCSNCQRSGHVCYYQACEKAPCDDRWCVKFHPYQRKTNGIWNIGGPAKMVDEGFGLVQITHKFSNVLKKN